MDKTSPYYRQVALLVHALHLFANKDCFTFKSGRLPFDIHCCRVV